MRRPNIERLEELYAIIDGIPKRHIRMSCVFDGPSEVPATNMSSPNLCGTIACAMGWAAMHPRFQALGLGLRFDDGMFCLTLNGKLIDYPQAAGEIFGIHTYAALDLFGPVLESERHSEDESDKKVFKRRVRQFLEAYRNVDSSEAV